MADLSSITPLQKNLVNAFIDGALIEEVAERYKVSIPEVFFAIRTVLKRSWTITPAATPDSDKE